MIKDTDSAPHEISPAGKAALEEYLEAERDRVLAEARRLSPSGTLGAPEIVNAIGALQARMSSRGVEYRSLEFSTKALVERLRLITMTGIVLAIMTVSFALVAVFDNRTQMEDFNGLLPALIVPLSSLIVVAFFLALEGRVARSRLKAVRFAQEALEPSVAHPSIATTTISIDSSTEPAAHFIGRWIAFESQLRRLAEDGADPKGPDSRRLPIGALLDILLTRGAITHDFYESTRSLLRVRNDLVHEAGRMSTGQAVAAVEQIDRLAEVLRRQSSPH